METETFIVSFNAPANDQEVISLLNTFIRNLQRKNINPITDIKPMNLQPYDNVRLTDKDGRFIGEIPIYGN